MIALKVDKKVEKGSPSFYRVKNSVRSDILIVKKFTPPFNSVRVAYYFSFG